jgi:succinate dehydrogenase / fumarate reductase membrane anchor subunit
MRYLTDRKRAEGLGAGGAGSHHHWKMLVSSILMVVMVPLFIIVMGSAIGRDHADVMTFFSRPVPALIAGLGLIVGIRHLMMEANEAVEDYVGGIKRKLTIVAVTAFCYTLMAAGLLSLLKLAL